MSTEDIIDIQKAIGTVPDGYWGPKSTAACQLHLRRMMPDVYPYPEDIEEFYGKPGRDLISIDVSELGVMYGQFPVSKIRCHKKVSADLLSIITEISESEFSWILKEYAGCYNDRPMRGGTKKSTHAWGIAIDLWPSRNGNRAHWPTDSMMPLGVMEIFAKHGWTCAGAAWSRDGMHFQATNV